MFLASEKKYVSNIVTSNNLLQATYTGSSVSLPLFFSGSLFELHLAKVEHGARTTVQTHLLFLRETQHGETFLRTHTKHLI